MRRSGQERQADVLEVLRAQDRPMTAYQILEALKPGDPGIAPPTVYRTLSALTEAGQTHRLESLNAFILCRCEHDAVPVLAICDVCGAVNEHDGSDLLPSFAALMTRTEFRAERHIVEIRGRCGDCAT